MDVRDDIISQPAGYLKAVWPDLFWVRFLVWPTPKARESQQNVGGEAPHIFEGFPGPTGPARPQKRTPTNPARLPSSTQISKPQAR